MKKVTLVVAALLALAVLFVASIFAASEMGSEVVTLTTWEADGSPVETRLWVVDDDGYPWLRAGVPTSSWLLRIEGNPKVQVDRGDAALDLRAVPIRDPERRDRIHALMRAKYGWTDAWISLIRDGSQSLAVRLEEPR
jgi:hypothetical protein